MRAQACIRNQFGQRTIQAYATTSAELKLLRRRRTLRRPGRSDLEAGVTPEEALFATQVPDAARADFAMAAAAAGASWTDPVELWWARLLPTRVGSRDGVGDPGCRGRRGRDVVAVGADGRGMALEPVAVPRAEVSFVRRGILFGNWPFALVTLLAPSTLLTFWAATVAADLVTRVGRCSEAGAL